MAENRRGGTIFFKVNSVLRDAKGSFTYNLGAMKREPILNADGHCCRVQGNAPTAAH